MNEAIGKYLSITRRAHAALLDKKLKPYNICHGQILLLVTLYKQEGISQHTLCQIYNLNKAGVGRSIKKLEDNGYIKKVTDPEDKRKKKIYLTKKAKDFKNRLFNIISAIESQLTAGLTDQEINYFIKTIKKIGINLGVKI